MSPVSGTTARLAAFVAVLVAAFGSAWAVGAAVPPSAGSSGSEPSVMDGHDDVGAGHADDADVVPTDLGRNVVPGTDLDVAGDYRPVGLPAPASSTTVDGYDVTLAGNPEPGVETALTYSVSRGGRPVDDLQPYLGAYGHLVTIRDGDLAYLHTHPGEGARAGGSGGPDIEFMTTFPSAGPFRLFLDFQVGGQVRTAAVTVEVGRH